MVSATIHIVILLPVVPIKFVKHPTRFAFLWLAVLGFEFRTFYRYNRLKDIVVHIHVVYEVAKKDPRRSYF